MRLIINILENYVVRVSFISWILAQSLKIVLYYIINKKISLERLIGAGGMPSSHSALVCSTAVAVYKQCGSDSVMFAISLVLAGIVMYDAMGVRRAAGEQAKVINKIIIDPLNKNNKKNAEKATDNNNFENIAMKTLKEFLGHTPLEVLGGALVGIVTGLIVPN